MTTGSLMGIWTHEERIENYRMNLVAGNLVWAPGDHPVIITYADLAGEDDRLTRVDPLLALIPDWRGFLQRTPDDAVETLHRHEGTVWPLGREGLSKTGGRAYLDFASTKTWPEGKVPEGN